jgi:hypothetical protein
LQLRVLATKTERQRQSLDDAIAERLRPHIEENARLKDELSGYRRKETMRQKAAQADVRASTAGTISSVP